MGICGAFMCADDAQDMEVVEVSGQVMTEGPSPPASAHTPAKEAKIADSAKLVAKIEERQSIPLDSSKLAMKVPLPSTRWQALPGWVTISSNWNSKLGEKTGTPTVPEAGVCEVTTGFVTSGVEKVQV